MIQSIQISARRDDDSWAWSFTPNGQASSKSAYQLLRKEDHKDEDDWPWWRVMWSLNVYLKTKNINLETFAQ